MKLGLSVVLGMPMAGLVAWGAYLLAGQYTIILVAAIIYWVGLLVGKVFLENE